MEQGQSEQRHVVWLGLVRTLHAPECVHSGEQRNQVAVSQQHALDSPGRAGRVENRRRVGLTHLDSGYDAVHLRSDPVQHGEELGGVDEDGSEREVAGKLPGGRRRGESDGGSTESDLVSDLRVGAERVGRRDGDAQREQGEVHDGDVE